MSSCGVGILSLVHGHRVLYTQLHLSHTVTLLEPWTLCALLKAQQSFSCLSRSGEVTQAVFGAIGPSNPLCLLWKPLAVQLNRSCNRRADLGELICQDGTGVEPINVQIILLVVELLNACEDNTDSLHKVWPVDRLRILSILYAKLMHIAS